ncbi:MAG: bacterioferritin-associated ferredoxin [Pirellula sp.]|jgi:bacterioferritin-associated ferredoxin
MKPDDELCLCFHITWRKVINYIRVNKITRPSQLHECGGAGSGCGWCRKQLTKLTSEIQQCPPTSDTIEEWLNDRSPNKESYAEGRQKYRESLSN